MINSAALKKLYSWSLTPEVLKQDLIPLNLLGDSNMSNNASPLLYLDKLPAIADTDVSELQRKEQTYRGSWKKRGGTGAFMMLARKWDRIENISENAGYDIFDVLSKEGLDGADGTLIAEIRDLRRYLMLVEAELTNRMGNP